MLLTYGTAGVTRVYGQNDHIVFPKFSIHGFGRGDDGDSAADAEDTILEEWVEPGESTQFTSKLNQVLSLTVICNRGWLQNRLLLQYLWCIDGVGRETWTR